MNANKYEQLFATNEISGIELAKIISGKKFIDTQRASFVYTASISGNIGKKVLVGYPDSKRALTAGVRSLSLEIVPRKITANCISPGYILTDLTKNSLSKLEDQKFEDWLRNFPLGPGQPEDVANACVFLLSDAAKWITGTNLNIDGGRCAHLLE